VVFCVIAYHVMGIFAAGANLYLHESAVELPLNVPSAYFNAWAIPLLFAISGAAAFLALRSHSAADYLRSRVARLLVPFLFGTLLLVPLQVYGVLLSDPGLLRLNLVPISDPHLLDNYPHFYLQYLLSYWYFLGHYSPQLEFVFWGHLWFIARLIVCAVATLPLLLLLNTGPGKRLIGLVNRVLLWPPAMLLPGLLLGGVIVVLRQPWAQPPLGSWATLDWAQFAVLVLCYLVGYALYADPRGVRAIERAGLLPLFVGIVAFVLLIGFNWATFPGQLGVDLRRMTEGMVDWAWVLVFLGLGIRALARSSRVLPYLNEGTYTFYVLHMPVLIAVAAIVLPLAAPIAVKVLLLLVGTLTLTFALYALVVRRFALTRALLGVHLVRRPTRSTARLATVDPSQS
jgi:surface polysaccharide O-acyltransferase-like enzyme